MRSNEKLALLAKQGDRQAVGELWEQNTGILFRLMYRYFSLAPLHGLTKEDLMQESYFALIRAVDAYDPQKGLAFASYLSYHVKTVALEALTYHHRGRRNCFAPVAVSLHEPLPGTEDITHADTIEDESAAADREQPVDKMQHTQLCACLEKCISELRPEIAFVLRAHYLEGKTLREIGHEMGVNSEYVRQLEKRGFRDLRHPRRARQLLPFLYYDALEGNSLQTFKNRGYVSRVEVLAGTY